MRVCGGGGEGGGRGCPAVSRAAAAGRSPREKELRAAAAGRHTPARPARLSVGAAGCTALRRPGLSRGAPLRSKLLWRPVGNCGRRAPCGWGLRAGGLVCAFAGQPPEIAEESEVLRVRGGAPRRVGIRSHKPSPAGVLERVKRQRSWRGAVLLRKPQKKSLALRVFQQVPGGVGLRRRRRRRRETAPQALASGVSRACFSRPGVGVPR